MVVTRIRGIVDLKLFLDKDKNTFSSKRVGKKKVYKYTLDKEVYEYHEQLYKYRHDRNDTNDNDLIADLKTSLF